MTNWHQIQAKETCKNGYAGDENESFASGANDIIVVKQSDGTLLSTNVTVQVWLLKNLKPQKCKTNSIVGLIFSRM